MEIYPKLTISIGSLFGMLHEIVLLPIETRRASQKKLKPGMCRNKESVFGL